jgi:hypothetical protein
MWEWRAFDDPGRLALPPRLSSGGPSSDETRADLYIIIDGRPDVGLKIRNVVAAPKLELKLRYERHPDGAELWAKVLERRLPVTADWTAVLLELLALDPRRASPIASAQDLLALAPGRAVLAEKTIRKVPAPPALELERALVTVGARALESVALEAPTLDLLRAELARHALSGGRARGYPEELRAHS